MASFITAGNATNGLQVSSDNTGILELKSGTGSGTTAVTIGTTGNINFPVSGQRITGDFSNATIANRVAFKTSTTNGNTSITAFPNGTGNAAFFQLRSYDVDAGSNGNLLQILVSEAAGVAQIGTSAVGTGTALPMTFNTGGSERARITSGGDLLVGTTSSGGKITVNDGNVHINWGGGYFNSLDRGMTIVAGGYNDTTNKARVVHVGGVGDNGNRCGWTAYGIKTGGTGNGSQYYLRPVTWSGSAFAEQGSAGVYLADNATSWTSASDERLKDIIEPITDAANKVASLRAVIGKYKTDDEGTRRTFLIAQDVQAVLPEAVDANNPDELGLAYTDTIPLLVAAIKELNAKVEALEAQLKGNA